MTPQQISADIGRGLDLRATIKTAQAELKTLEKRLEQAGLHGEQIPLQEEDREGRQFLARCPKLGLIIPVVFESDQIVASYRQGSAFDGQMLIHCVANEIDLHRFFVPETTYSRLAKDGQQFRRSAREILGCKAPGFVAQCLQRDKAGLPKSRTIIAWDNARPIDQVPA